MNVHIVTLLVSFGYVVSFALGVWIGARCSDRGRGRS